MDSQGKKKRQHGNDAVKSHILAARTVANIVRTSLVSNRTPRLQILGYLILKTSFRDRADLTRSLFRPTEI